MNGATRSSLPVRYAALALGLMWLAAALAWWFTPTLRLVEQRGVTQLAQTMPEQFGEWRSIPSQFTTIINPQQAASLERLYSQTLNRLYVNTAGQRVMLSLAYGEDQRDGLQLHYPEVCYPSQGFQILSKQDTVLSLPHAQLPIRQLATQLGSSRQESVTYWTLLGSQPYRGGLEKKRQEMGFGFRGLIPDGLLFRISSIESDAAQGFALHQRFARDLASALPEAHRIRLMGQTPL